MFDSIFPGNTGRLDETTKGEHVIRIRGLGQSLEDPAVRNEEWKQA
jgi:hypothetical protein